MHEERKFVTSAPENSETPLGSMRSWVTSNRLFFVRNHFGVPEIDRHAWRLTIGGLVARPLVLSWAELLQRPERTVFATMECAGNGRSFLKPLAHGVQWGAGAVGHAEWTGVPLADLLNEAGIEPEAVEVVGTGADRGSEADHPAPMNFARGLPLRKALDPDTLVVTRMNGELLEPNHGAPARLLVPGWYGVASVKWLTDIELVDRPFTGYFQSTKYTIEREGFGGRDRLVVGPMAIKSEFIRPLEGESLGRGTNRLFGVAWAGEDAIQAVEVSTDGGRSWQSANLVGPTARYSWTMWEFLWETTEPGTYTLLSRAVSAGGAVQPMAHSPLHGGYVIHFSRPRTVTVEESKRSDARRADAETLLYDMAWYAEENSRRPLDVELELMAGAGI
ncbi:MAG: sulfite oxidase [Pirellulales bacterium]|nr:sulfite oxidase [Pirellulales bacterium]